jgi:tRNA threonylcarbamoyladenosine modification (KEOPS) complex  Pcc1 subunit
MSRYSIQIKAKMKEKEIPAACKALESETDFKGKAEIKIKKEPEALVVDISSEDLSSLHAAAGSILRALKVIASVQDKCKERGPGSKE